MRLLSIIVAFIVVFFLMGAFDLFGYMDTFWCGLITGTTSYAALIITDEILKRRKP